MAQKKISTISAADRPYILNKKGKEAELLIYDEIGSGFWTEGVTAKQFASDLKAAGNVSRINVRINSPGGSVFDGLAIFNALKSHPAEVVVHIDGMALSMASVIAMAGNTISIAENALMMIHDPQGMVVGSAEDMREQAQLLDKIRDSLAIAYEQKTGLNREQIVEMMREETWLNSTEAVEQGFADQLSSEPLAIAAMCRSVPEYLRDSPRAADLAPFIVKETAAMPIDSPPDVTNATDVEPTRVAATIEELRAMPGSSAEFVVEQLSNGSTFLEAQTEINRQLVAKLGSLQEQLIDFQKKLAAAESRLATALAEGNEPLVHASAGKPQQPWGSDPMRWLRNQVAQRQSAGMSASAAFREVAAEYPELMDHIN